MRPSSIAAKHWECDVVATAHHAEDQTETVFLALLRGTGRPGCAECAAGGGWRRDWIWSVLSSEIPSETLREYCHARALPYAVDPSNADTTLRRNAVREALSALRPLFPGLDAAVARAAEVVAEERDGRAAPHCGEPFASGSSAVGRSTISTSYTWRRWCGHSNGAAPEPST